VRKKKKKTYLHYAGELPEIEGSSRSSMLDPFRFRDCIELIFRINQTILSAILSLLQVATLPRIYLGQG